MAMDELSLSLQRPPSQFAVPPRNTGALFILALAFLSIMLVASGALFVLNHAREGQQAQFIEQNKIKEEGLRPELLNQIASLDERLKAVRTLLSNHTFASNIFRVLEADTHPDVRFGNFSFVASALKVDVTGEAASYRALARQIAIFEQDPQIRSVEFGGLSTTGEGLVGFKLSLIFQPTFLHLRQ